MNGIIEEGNDKQVLNLRKRNVEGMVGTQNNNKEEIR